MVPLVPRSTTGYHLAALRAAAWRRRPASIGPGGIAAQRDPLQIIAGNQFEVSGFLNYWCGLWFHVVPRVCPHLERSQRIVVLRALVPSPATIHYEWLEIPIRLLLKMKDLQPTEFTPRTNRGGSSVQILKNGQIAFTLRLDGAVEKVTISNLRRELCFCHASWDIPCDSSRPD